MGNARVSVELKSMFEYFPSFVVRNTTNFVEFLDRKEHSHFLVFLNEFDEFSVFYLNDFRIISINELFWTLSRSGTCEDLDVCFRSYSSFKSQGLFDKEFSELNRSSLEIVISELIQGQYLTSHNCASVNSSEETYEKVIMPPFSSSVFTSESHHLTSPVIVKRLQNKSTAGLRSLSVFLTKEDVDHPTGIFSFSNYETLILGEGTKHFLVGKEQYSTLFGFTINTLSNYLENEKTTSARLILINSNSMDSFYHDATAHCVSKESVKILLDLSNYKDVYLGFKFYLNLIQDSFPILKYSESHDYFEIKFFLSGEPHDQIKFRNELKELQIKIEKQRFDESYVHSMPVDLFQQFGSTPYFRVFRGAKMPGNRTKSVRVKVQKRSLFLFSIIQFLEKKVQLNIKFQFTNNTF